MRILYVHYMDPESGRGGMGVHILSSTAALRDLGHDVFVLGKEHGAAAATAPSRDRRSALRRRIAKYGFQPRALLRVPGRVPREMGVAREFRPDVAVVRYEAFEWQMWVVCAVLGIPLVVEVNATTRELVQWKRGEICVYPFTRTLERMVLRRAERVFAVSTILKGLLIEDGIDATRIGVVPNGADPNRFHPAVDAGVVRRRYGLENAVVVGFLGSFGRWHDIGLIADAIPAVLSRHPAARFLMAGAALEDLPASLREKFAGVADHVVFTGVVPLAEAPLYVAAMDVALTVFPAIPNFGPSVIKQFEYMAAGRAVVATAIGQQAEVIQDGVNGILIAPGDRIGLETAICRLVADPDLRLRLGETARATILQGFTWRHNAERITELCEQAMRQRSLSPAAMRAAHGREV